MSAAPPCLIPQDGNALAFVSSRGMLFIEPSTHAGFYFATAFPHEDVEGDLVGFSKPVLGGLLNSVCRHYLKAEVDLANRYEFKRAPQRRNQWLELLGSNR